MTQRFQKSHLVLLVSADSFACRKTVYVERGEASYMVWCSSQFKVSVTQCKQLNWKSGVRLSFISVMLYSSR